MTAIVVLASVTSRADILYETGFENFTPGVENLTGTESWQSTLDGQMLHGIDDGIIPGLGNSAFLGLDDPDDALSKEISAEVVSVFRQIPFAPIAEDKPMIEFEALIAIAASQDVAGTVIDESNFQDRFLISFYNGRFELLASIIYDNRSASYGLWRNDGTSTTDTDIEFIIETPQFLFVTIDFENNLWTATIDGIPIFSDKQFNSTGRSRDLGLIAAELRISREVSRPGGSVWRPANNWMIFDDWYVAAKPRSKPALTEPFVISKVERTVDNKVELCYPADAGCTYTVQYSADLGNWIELSNSPVSANVSDPNAKHTDESPSDETRYYRILRQAD